MLRRIDSLIGAGVVEKTGGHYPLVRRPAAAARRTARAPAMRSLRAQIADLGHRRDPDGLPFLLRVLAAAEHDDQRRLAAEALGEIGDERARPGLVAALDDHSGDVRAAAESALDRLPR